MVCLQTSPNRRNNNAIISDREKPHAMRTAYPSQTPLHATRSSRELRSKSPTDVTALPQNATFIDLSTAGRPSFRCYRTGTADALRFRPMAMLLCPFPCWTSKS